MARGKLERVAGITNAPPLSPAAPVTRIIACSLARPRRALEARDRAAVFGKQRGKCTSMDKIDTVKFTRLRPRAGGKDRMTGASREVSIRKSSKSCGCPVAAFQRMINGKYKIRILWDLKDGPLRYSAIRTGLLRGAEGTKEIAPRVLSRELKALAQIGLIARKDYGVVPPKVEYRLTPMGQSFVPVIATIQRWGMRHLAA